MPEDPDDIGYERRSGNDFAYDNKAMTGSEALAQTDEIKSPIPHYNLAQTDVQPNANGTKDIKADVSIAFHSL